MVSTDSKGSEVEIQNIEPTEDAEKLKPFPLDAHYDPAFVKKTIRMVDWRMLPLLGLLYSVALIDRTNLGVAYTAGMVTDLGIAMGERYSIASMIYFFPYILLQIPGNIILRFLGARSWLTICVVGWGVAQLGMAFVPTWGFLCLCRVFLGVFESGFFPSLVFIVTTWYKRYEVQKRLALFYLSSIVVASFSSILAFGFTQLAGKAGLNGWQWIFLIEGALTIVLGVLTWFFIPDFPDKSKFLNEEQRKMILDRVEADRGDSIPDQMTWPKLWKHLADPVLWLFGMVLLLFVWTDTDWRWRIIAFMFLASTVPAYAIGFFITIILRGMGFSESLSLILTAPPGIFAAASCFFFAWVSDKTRKRAIWLAVQNCICIAGLAIATYTKSNPVRYFGLFLVNAGATGCVPGVLAYSSNNIRSHTKRAVQTAVIIASGGVGGIMASTVFRQKDYPKYVNGMWATIGLQLMMMVLLCITTYIFKKRNRLRREGKLGPLEGAEDFYYTT